MKPYDGAAPLRLPSPLQAWLEQSASAQLAPPGAPKVDFAKPAGEPALAPPESVSWQVFKNPVALFVGGVAAVLMELAEPRVREGVWGHTSFRDDPRHRLQRTGLAAMVTVYGARSVAEATIADVRRMHDRVRGTTSGGGTYHANDPELLRWVQATAAFGFLQAYHAYVHPLPLSARDRYYGEGEAAAQLYGAEDIPTSEADLQALFRTMLPRLEASDIVFEFLKIMGEAPILPLPLRPLQHLLLRAAVEITPPAVRTVLGLDRGHGLRAWEAAPARFAGAMADRLVLTSSPPAQACLRLGLPVDYLYHRTF
jgi:uncharacterized protein (DUF2236 family)